MRKRYSVLCWGSDPSNGDCWEGIPFIDLEGDQEIPSYKSSVPTLDDPETQQGSSCYLVRKSPCFGEF